MLVAVGANEPVVPASELQEAMKRIKQLEAALRRKTLENDILKEAADYAKAKKWIVCSPLLHGDDISMDYLEVAFRDFNPQADHDAAMKIAYK